MKCAVHPEVDATGFCRNCGKPMCPTCARPVRDVLYCEPCLAQVIGLPAPPAASGDVLGGAALPSALPPVPPPAGKQSSNPGVAFLLGLIPGLGAIYNGEYNKGLVHLVVFAALIVGLSSDLDAGPTVALSLLLAGFVLYMAVDAMRTAKAKSNGETLSDPIETWTRNRPVGPFILIGAGVMFLLYNFGLFDRFPIGKLFWPVVLIGVGFMMLRNRVGSGN
jgi:Domain of unknown function (DUF5668)/B-box zinc finger